jgi:t-SNARE complex subunit (syntaxin)
MDSASRFDVSNLICSFNSCHVQSRSQLVDQQQLLEPDLRARDRELTEIAKSIATLAELFKDLSSLVIDQGTLLDSVEYNIEQTAVHMNESVKELDIATRFVHSRVVIVITIKV